MARKKMTKAGDSSEAASHPSSDANVTKASSSKPRRKVGRKKATASAKSRKARKPESRRGRGKRYTDAERAKILATAQREGLTGAQVKERFGVSTLSYYLWRKKARSVTKAPKRGGRPRGPRLNSIDLEGQVRAAVRERIQELMPLLIRQQAGSLLGAGRRRR